MTSHFFQGQPLCLENLDAWLQELDSQGLIPYEGRKEDHDSITFTLGYTGGWGLGYITTINYNKTHGKWSVSCMIDSTVFEGQINGRYIGDTIFGGALRIEYLNPERSSIEVSSVTNSLDDLVELGMYYSLESMRLSIEDEKRNRDYTMKRDAENRRRPPQRSRSPPSRVNRM